MAVFNQNQDSYETIEGIALRAAKQVKKAIAKTSTSVVSDVKQNLGLEVSPDTTTQAANPKSQATMNVPSNNDQDKQKLAQVRANLEKINQEIKRIREEREKKEQQGKQASQAQQAQQAEKKVEEKKKDTVLQKLIKSKKGTKEAMTKASG